MKYTEDIKSAYISLEEQNEKLVERYIKPHKSNIGSVDNDFLLDVKSYLVLLHAAIEDYVEWISVFSSKAACDIFKDKGIITIPFLFLFQKSDSLKKRLKIKKGKITDSPKEFILSNLKEIHQITIQNAIINNGINTMYLNSLLQKCGINFDTTAKEFDGWKKLADYRGDYAHAVLFHNGRKPRANRILTPEAAEDIGSDCISFCLHLKEEALAALAWEIEKK